MKKNIVMIGGSNGIGLALAKLIHTDVHLYIASKSTPSQEQLEHTYIPFNVLEQSLDVSNLPEQIDGFIYCPGSITLKPFKRLQVEDFKKDMDINFFGLVTSFQSIVSRMSKGSSAIFFSTVAVAQGMPFHSSIAAAKSAVEGFAKAIAAEYAPNIRVNVIAPSLTDTPLASRLLNTDAKKALHGDKHPLKRVGTAEDIAATAAFLLSDKSSWITGQVLHVNGGLNSLSIA